MKLRGEVRQAEDRVTESDIAASTAKGDLEAARSSTARLQMKVREIAEDRERALAELQQQSQEAAAADGKQHLVITKYTYCKRGGLMLS